MRDAVDRECSFKLSHYEYCLKSAKDKGYSFAPLKDHEKCTKERMIFLRHDVDSDPDLALHFADIEKKLKIRATYFFRVHAEDNLFSLRNYAAVKRIIKEGHEIGLHAETDFASLVGEQGHQMLLRGKAVLEAIAGSPISGVSMHEPTRSTRRLKKSEIKKLGFRYDAYDPLFFVGLKYISDSSCRWREGCMCNFIKAGVPKLYILTHPVWWYKQSPIENY
jgi:peptidoglycan/xylan/chitin deacetylase (PgdA/CDA1 family)